MPREAARVPGKKVSGDAVCTARTEDLALKRFHQLMSENGGKLSFAGAEEKT